jgi:Flp pilus assembly pilin Flp
MARSLASKDSQRRLARRHDRGVSSVEYIIILVLVALTGIAVFKLFGGTIKTKMQSANTTMQNDVNPQ